MPNRVRTLPLKFESMERDLPPIGGLRIVDRIPLSSPPIPFSDSLSINREYSNYFSSLGLEAEDEASRGLRCMRPGVRTQTSDIEIGRLVDIAAILSAQ